MATSPRKKKIKHIKADTIGVKTTVRFGPKTVRITVSIPRQHLANRLAS